MNNESAKVHMKLKTPIKYTQLDDTSDEGWIIYKSVMAKTINAKGLGKSHEEALSDLKENIANLYPAEVDDSV